MFPERGLILYEVDLDVRDEIATAYRAWLEDHVRQMLTLPGFLGAEIASVHEPLAAGHQGWRVSYRLRDRAALDQYFAEHAERMRADALQRFAGQFSARRRVLAPEWCSDTD